MTIPLTFLEPAPGLRLAKVITQDGSTPYPRARVFTSHTHYLAPNEDGVREALGHFQAHALKGHALIKGVLKTALINEPRRGKSDTNAPTNLLVIDLDDYIPEVLLPASVTAADLAATTRAVRALLPAPLNTTACIANASASTGHKANGVIGLHLFFLLDKPVPPSQLSHWLTGLNFGIDSFRSQTKLNRSGISVKWVCDPVVSRNAQIVYIAPPELKGVADPFATPADRWAVIEGEQWTCDIQPLLHETIPSVIQKYTEGMLNDLRKTAGLSRMKPNYRRMVVNGETLQVLTNPDQMQLVLTRTSDTHAYWNINGGDSNAYWNPIGNPEIIYNFKGEPPFELRRASEETYNWYCEKFKTQIREISDPRPLAFRDQASDQHYAVEYNPRDDRVLRSHKIQKQNIADWCAGYGMPIPDPIPNWDVEFNPQSTVVIDWDNQRLNQFQATDLLRNPPPVMPAYANRKIGEAKDALQELCPSIFRVLHHICGSADTEFEWFMNWLAYTIQTRNKAMTAWVFSGVPGTGKGIFFDRILRPLIGELYATRKRLDHLEEQFNAYLQQTLFLVYDEFRLNDSAQSGKLLNKLKDEITGATSNIRAMRTDTAEVANYTNYIFFSNHLDVIRIEEGDRRFNIAPPQLIPLRAVWPEVTSQLSRIDDEIGTFAGFLMAYAACENSAKTCIENQAKATMKRSAMQYNERFCMAAKHGEFDYFLDVLDMDLANDLTRSTQITTAQKYVKHWAKQIGAGPTKVPVSDLLTVYLALGDIQANKMSQKKLTLLLGRNDLHVERVRVNGDKTPCITTTWYSTELSAEEVQDVVGNQPMPAHQQFTTH